MYIRSHQNMFIVRKLIGVQQTRNGLKHCVVFTKRSLGMPTLAQGIVWMQLTSIAHAVTDFRNMLVSYVTIHCPSPYSPSLNHIEQKMYLYVNCRNLYLILRRKKPGGGAFVGGPGLDSPHSNQTKDFRWVVEAPLYTKSGWPVAKIMWPGGISYDFVCSVIFQWDVKPNTKNKIMYIIYSIMPIESFVNEHVFN